MKRNTISLVSIAIVLSLILMGCSATALIPSQALGAQPAAQVAQVAATATSQPAPTAQSPSTSTSSNQSSTVTTGNPLAAYESTLEAIYAQVNPSVVNISVVVDNSNSNSNNNGFGNQNLPQSQVPQFSQGAGSGFVWDTQGHIVTNNHVVDGATQITVTFADGTSGSATVVGTDPSSDLAVIKVDAPASELHPVTMADSSQLKVGQVAIAIGNPFTFSGSMTTGIVSALNRSLPSTEAATNGPTYSIPDVIQTDAPINPGNSGGVLLDDQGRVIGVTSDLVSSTNSSSGIGFAIPSNIVSKVIPALISTGHYDHPYLGVTGTDLTPDLAKAMNLPATQRGALVEDLVPGGPVDKAGLHASSTDATILGQTVRVGGDVITKINGTTVNTMDDLIAYLNDNTQVGQKVTLTFLRDGKEMTADVTLEARPATPPTTSTTGNNGNNNNNNNNNRTAGTAYLGISAVTLTPDIAQAMNLNQNTTGVLIEQTQSGGPARQAGLQAGTQSFVSNGQQVVIGGDIITKIDNTPITSVADLQSFLAGASAGQTVSMTVIRGSNTMTVQVTLGSR